MGAGATVQITVGGQYLDPTTQVLISSSGIQAKIVNFEKPLTQGQFNRMRDQLQELAEKKKTTPAKYTETDEKTVADLRKKMATVIRRRSRLRTQPALALGAHRHRCAGDATGRLAHRHDANRCGCS